MKKPYEIPTVEIRPTTDPDLLITSGEDDDPDEWGPIHLF